MWTFETMMSEPSGWLDATGPRADVVLSTRVRAARNLAGRAFPHAAEPGVLLSVRVEVLAAARDTNYLANALVVGMESTDSTTRDILVERHIASAEFARPDPWRAVIVAEREIVTAMVNEEDHLRLQCIRGGLAPLEAWRLVERIDSEMDRNLHYAFDSDWGYLTSCPTNVGTGLRVSVLAHLVGLVRTGDIAQVLASVGKLGLAVRGIYGEGSAPVGGFFQISNQTTLGQSEEDVAYTLERVGAQLADLELAARETLRRELGRRLLDEVHRAHGVLTSARLISAGEVMERCSVLRLGVGLGLIEDVDLAVVNRLLVLTQPGHVAYARGGGASAGEPDAARADLVRRALSSRGH
jgi:protein arginine kinase